MSQSYEDTLETGVTILSKVGDHRRAHLPWGEQSDIRLSGAETGGALGVLDYQAPAGFVVPRHVHHREDEILRVVRGRAVFWTPQLSGSIEVGDVIKLPKGIEHAWRHFGDEPIGFLVDVAPAGFETFFAATEAANLREDDILERSRIALQFGIEITGPGLSDRNVQDILQGHHPSAEEIDSEAALVNKI
jgi:mannose-6-phosphate isomerase-like protein (cupin superfamily)